MDEKPRIMLVDDEERFRITTGRLLSVRGFEVTDAGSGKEALEELKKNAYDVIVLDVRMPEMTGIEALAAIKKVQPGVEVIILTGHASVDTAVEIMRLGGCEYLLKPCSIDDLVDKIEAACERRKSRKDLTGKLGPTEHR